ncbi:stage II sporulation protein D [Clostridium sp. CAG:433]|nr:stage II sporulation protein D [Clostridium sp. CAG:433]
MFDNYIIKNETLYIDLNINYDFGNFKNTKTSFKKELKKFLNSLKINFNKIVLTCSGVIIGSIILTNNNFNDDVSMKYVPNIDTSIPYIAHSDNEEKTDDNIIVNNDVNETKENVNNSQNISKNVEKSVNTEHTNTDNTSVNNTTNSSVSEIAVYRSNGSVINLNMTDYLIGVVSSEMPASFNLEALKAQSVLARTYALKAKQTGKKLTDTVSTQSYIDIDQMKNKWGNSFNTYYNKIKNAVENTNGEYLSYNGNYIEALYHSTNNGKTESSLDVFGNYYPYLVSVSSEYDKNASSYLRTISMPLDTISNKLGLSLNNDSVISIISYTDGGNIKEININGNNFSGKKVRELLGLRSADFDISISDNNANITTRGYGHGVGMSQYGANGMANAGYSYKDILSHYYPGTTLTK